MASPVDENGDSSCEIMRTIKQSWSFEPIDGGEPACTDVTFIYSQR